MSNRAPVASLDWQFLVNQPSATSTWLGSENQIMVDAKNVLKAFPLNPWTVLGSSDGATAAMDNGDRWTTSAKIVYGSAGVDPHSWLVLRQPSGVEVCWDANGSFLQVIWSAAGGFTGGTLTDRPTAPGEVMISAYLVGTLQAWIGGTLLNDTRIHALHTTDGMETMLFVTTKDLNTPFATGVASSWLFRSVADPWSAWTAPQRMARVSNLSTAGAVMAYRSTWFGTYSANYLFLAAPMISEASVPEFVRPNELTGKYMFAPASVFLPDVGELGRLDDLWFTRPPGAGYGNENTYEGKKFASFNGVVVPWNEVDDVVFG